MPLWAGDPEFKQYVRMGEVQFAEMRGRRRRRELRRGPGSLCEWTVQRFLFFWDGTPHPRTGIRGRSICGS